jgi:hypothetical protein
MKQIDKWLLRARNYHRSYRVTRFGKPQLPSECDWRALLARQKVSG